MKNIYYLAVLCILNATSFAQVQSSCEVTSELEYYYKRDVADLAINRLFASNSPDTNQIEIPQVYLDSIWNGLSAIFNASSIPERDSIFDIYCIHNISYHTIMLLPHIYISVDTSVSWTSNWLNGEIVTGYTELDDFISNYDYNIFSTHPNYASVVIYSDTIINSYAISDSLTSFNGIETAGPIPMTIDANKIQYSVEGEYQYFTFTLAWGDCMSGCIYNHKWKFKVHYSNCTVEYLGLESNANNNFPNPINCNITSVSDIDINPDIISIYPNPSIDKISIKGERIQNIELLNGIGQFITSIRPNSNLTTINIEDLKPGLYFLKIDIDGQSINKRLIKK
ncbi:MAG: T9SS type A sorting domain-containing protein [Bacteroidetes bacterium]|nr:T9SS type A sorting domain-containing protein [Bacteroidota bacterium]MBL7103491.1 T9SS type A sorting domain-containing protein [Bacteroidales bacterium]